MTVNITDIEKSVAVGEVNEERLRVLLKERYGYIIEPLPAFSDIDWLVLSVGFGEPNELFFLEVKVREQFFEEAIFPERKYTVALFIKEHLKINVYAICYFIDICKAFLYDLTKPVRVQEVTRRDRDVTINHGYYKAVKEIPL